MRKLNALLPEINISLVKGKQEKKSLYSASLRKQLTFCDATGPQKFHTDDASLPRSIRSSTQLCVVTHHQYGISAFVSQTSFRGETNSGVLSVK